MTTKSSDLIVTVMETEKEIALATKCQRMLTYHTKENIVQCIKRDTSLEEFLGGSHLSREDIHFILLKKYCLVPHNNDPMAIRIHTLLQTGQFQEVDRLLTYNRTAQDNVLDTYLANANTSNLHLTAEQQYQHNYKQTEVLNETLLAMARYYNGEKEKAPITKRRNYN